MLAPAPETSNEDDVEITTAANYLAGHLLAHCPRAQLATFRSALLSALRQKCSRAWNPANPEKGSAYRSLSFIGGRADPVVEAAAAEAGITGNIASFYPGELMWVGL